jgi:hypothetical protein
MNRVSFRILPTVSSCARRVTCTKDRLTSHPLRHHPATPQPVFPSCQCIARTDLGRRDGDKLHGGRRQTRRIDAHFVHRHGDCVERHAQLVEHVAQELVFGGAARASTGGGPRKQRLVSAACAHMAAWRRSLIVRMRSTICRNSCERRADMGHSRRRARLTRQPNSPQRERPAPGAGSSVARGRLCTRDGRTFVCIG